MIAGIGVNFTLFLREDRASKVNAAREGLRQVQTLEDETQRHRHGGRNVVPQGRAGARGSSRLLDSTMALARENLRLRTAARRGPGHQPDVNDARNALARSETARAVAAYDFVVALAQLLEASGRARALPEYVQLANIQLRP